MHINEVRSNDYTMRKLLSGTRKIIEADIIFSRNALVMKSTLLIRTYQKIMIGDQSPPIRNGENRG